MAPGIEEQATAAALPLLEQAGCELWDVCFEKEGAMWYLRVLFDREEGVDSDSCEEISRPINELFDKQPFIEQVDILEIGTPGLSRRLRKAQHFRAWLGQPVRAQVNTEKGESYITGILDNYNEEKNEITVSGETVMLKKCIKVNAEPDDSE